LVSSVDRVLKRFPQLEPFTFSAPALGNTTPIRQISNRANSPAAGQTVDFSVLLSIAQGVPRSFPFHGIAMEFTSPAFGEPLPAFTPTAAASPGVVVGDSWWVNGRVRTLMSVTAAEVQEGSKKLPAPAEAVTSVLAACGKVKSTSQMPLPTATAATLPQAAQAGPPIAGRVSAVLAGYRQRLAALIESCPMPHDLPAPAEAWRDRAAGVTSGSKKPALVAAFRPMGYDCKGGSGTFQLRRRTAANLTVDVSLDVGTWSNSLTAFFEVHGAGFTARLPLPACKRAAGAMQYPIGDGERWGEIVNNLAALVAELDRTFVPEIEAAAGPSPEWYTP
jgi:hypothetical protein